MPSIRFTQNIQRHVACPPHSVDADDVRTALEQYFQGNESARGYVLDDQCELRKHMAIFINGIQIKDRKRLSDRVEPDDVIDVMQALSGG
jgi:molybdopterin synthase sulfur carrier subunit